jgi:hypothetical protein
VLVHYILGKAVKINAMAACRAVVVDALNPREFRWWQRFGFVPLDPDEASNLNLYLLTGDIERTLAEAATGPADSLCHSMVTAMSQCTRYPAYSNLVVFENDSTPSAEIN